MIHFRLNHAEAWVVLALKEPNEKSDEKNHEFIALKNIFYSVFNI